MKICLYFNCYSSEKDKSKNISFFHLPFDNEELCKSWVKNCGVYNEHKQFFEGVYNKGELSKLIVCEKHFNPKDILINHQRKRKLLFRYSVPISFKDAYPQQAARKEERSIPTPYPIHDSTVNQRCFVKGCNHASLPGRTYLVAKNRIITFHTFPNPKEESATRLNLWLKNLGINKATFFWSNNLVVCSEHFEGKEFVYEGEEHNDKKRKLKDDAVPTILNGVTVTSKPKFTLLLEPETDAKYQPDKSKTIRTLPDHVPEIDLKDEPDKSKTITTLLHESLVDHCYTSSSNDMTSGEFTKPLLSKSPLPATVLKKPFPPASVSQTPQRSASYLPLSSMPSFRNFGPPPPPQQISRRAFCRKCTRSRREMTVEEIKIVKYYYNIIRDFGVKYERQNKYYQSKIGKEKLRLKTVQEQLEALTKTVDDLKKDADISTGV